MLPASLFSATCSENRHGKKLSFTWR